MTLKPSTAILVVILLALVVGSVGFLGSRVPVEAGEIARAGATAQETGQASVDRLNAVLDALIQNAASGQVRDAAVEGGIAGMLRTLDPHSRFFPPDEFRELREQQSGTYSGLGITVSNRFGRITIVAPPFPGAPAEKAGLRVGDVISHVNGDPIEGLEMTDVVSLLKGPRGTPVDIRVVRPGIPEPLDIRIVRDEISSFTISNAFLIEDDIAYVKIDNFSGTTSDELRDALDRLGPDRISGLILDLRGNPGGLMQEAIEVSEIFLEDGQRILETRGRYPGTEHSYRADGRTTHEYPLVVVINRQSASASEIVSGAIQDHDRGLVIGETSFGKGLVQSVFALDEGAGLALTTQKWYTPSGRLIQRDYSEISEFDYYNGDVVIEPSADDIYYSDLGRVVYGGGGITPDEIVRAPELNDVESRLTGNFAFFTFAAQYSAGGLDAPEDLVISDTILGEFLAHTTDRGIDLTASELERNRDFVAARLRYEIVYNRFGVSEAARVLIDDDPQIQRAIDLMPESGALARRARQTDVN